MQDPWTPQYEPVPKSERLRLKKTPTPLPDWLTVNPELANEPINQGGWIQTRTKPPPSTERDVSNYKTIFSRVLEAIYGGNTLVEALEANPYDIHPGAFMKWLYSDSERYAMYKEAKEVRSEVYASRLVQIAEGKDPNGDPVLEDLARSKLKIDVYKHLMGADNRKVYGDSKTLDITSTISITAALSAADNRRLQPGMFEDAEFETVEELLALPPAQTPTQTQEEDDEWLR